MRASGAFFAPSRRRTLLPCIGQGAYGQVWLCQKKDSRVLYAMKIIAKTVLNKPVNLGRVIRERQLLAVESGAPIDR